MNQVMCDHTVVDVNQVAFFDRTVADVNQVTFCD